MSPSLDQLSTEFNRLFPLVQAPPPPPPPPKPAPAKPAAAPKAAAAPDLKAESSDSKPATAPAGDAAAAPAAGSVTAATPKPAAPVGPDLGRGPTAPATEVASATPTPPAPALAPTPAPAAPAETAAPAAVKPAPAPRPAAAPRPVAAAPAAPTPPPVPVMVPPSKLTDRAFTGYDLDATVPAQDIVKAIELVDQAGFTMDCITGVDWIDQKEMEVVYDFFHTSTGQRIVVRARVPREKAELPTISEIFPGASWHERETHDFFGIVFVGHPHLVPILLEDDATYHPLRKDYPGAAPFER